MPFQYPETSYIQLLKQHISAKWWNWNQICSYD